MEMIEVMEQMSAGVARLAAAAEVLEGWAGRVRADAEANGSVGRITAALEPGAEAWAGREEELQRRLDQALGALATLQAEGAQRESRSTARKTLPAATVQLLAKQGVDVADAVDVSTLDAALAGMSVEQRIAVKSQLMRTGSLTL
jgi:hypothetical protein